MLTKADVNWLKHLSNSEKVKIVPHDTKAKEIFGKQKREIIDILGQDVTVVHCGASGMGISGQDEIDVVIPASLELFDDIVAKLKKAYGSPDRFYPKQRARFNRQQANKKIELAVVNRDSEQWRRSSIFEAYLKNHPESLEAYRKLKEANNGIVLREYYRSKMEFINSILDKAFTD